MQKRTLFLISDGTGISIETLSRCIISQFESVSFNIITKRYINTSEKANSLVEQINSTTLKAEHRPMVFCTFANKKLSKIVKNAHAFVLDFFQEMLKPVEKELNTKASLSEGLSHSIKFNEKYEKRINAIQFALENDDGVISANYDDADVIIIGVSRTGKTPTSIYLAVRYSLKVANFPITPEDLIHHLKPKILKQYKDKIFGLTTSPEHLHLMRKERMPNTKYSSLKQCKFELSEVEELFRTEKILHLDTTNLSIEETSTKILHMHEQKSRRLL